MADYHYSNDPKDTYRTLLSVGDKDNLGLHATTQRDVWTDDGDATKSDAPFQLAMDAMQMQGTRRLEFNDDGTYINSSGDGILNLVGDGTGIANTISIDSASGITLDADNATYGITYSDGATAMLRITNATSDVVFKQLVNDKDIVFQQDDANEVIRVGNDRKLYFYDKGGEHITSDGTDMTISSGNDMNLTATADINIPANVGLTFGHASAEKIESTGSAMTITSAALTVDCAGDITLNADGGDFIFSDASVSLLTITNSSSDVVIKPLTDDKDIIFQQYDGTEVARIENDTYLSIAVGLRADAQDGATIGTATHQFSDLYLADRAAILFGDDGDITMTHVADTGVTIAGSHTNGTNLRIDNSAGDGDSVIQFALSDSVQYSMGVEDGDSDKFVINFGTGVLGHQPALEISSAGAVNIPGALTTGSISYSALTVSNGTATKLTIHNTDEEDSDGGRDGWLIFTGETAAGASHQLAYIKAIHDSGEGAGGNVKDGGLLFYTNDGGDSDDALTKRLELDNAGNVRCQGAVGLPATSKLYLDGEDCSGNTYIHESAADVLGFFVGGATKMVIDANSKVSISNNDSGDKNTIFGKNAGVSLDIGSDSNTFIGENVSDATMDNAVHNTGVGYGALGALTSGDYNVALGSYASGSNTTGNYNMAFGYQSLYENEGGSENVAIGHNAGKHDDAGADAVTVSQCVIIGAEADFQTTTPTNEIVIGYNANGIADNYAVIGNASITRLYAADDVGAVLYAGSATVQTSDMRIKEDIKDTSLGLAFVNKLRPVEYKKRQPADYDESLKKEMSWYKNGKNPRVLDELDKNKSRTGFIAQEVGEILSDMNFDDNNDIVEIDESNTQQMIAYSKLVPPLVKAIQELSAKVEALESAN